MDQNKKIRIDLEFEAKSLRSELDKIQQEMFGGKSDYAKSNISDREYSRYAREQGKDSKSNPFLDKDSINKFEQIAKKLEDVTKLQGSVESQSNKERREYLKNLGLLNKKEMEDKMKLLKEEINKKDKNGLNSKDEKEDLRHLRTEYNSQYSDDEQKKLLTQLRNVNYAQLSVNALNGLLGGESKTSSGFLNVVQAGISGGVTGATYGSLLGPWGTALGAASGFTAGSGLGFAKEMIPRGAELEKATNNLATIMSKQNADSIGSGVQNLLQEIGVQQDEFRELAHSVSMQGFSVKDLEKETLSQARLKKGFGLDAASLSAYVSQYDKSPGTTEEKVLSMMNQFSSKGFLSDSEGNMDLGKMPKYLQKIAEITERNSQIMGRTDSSIATSSLLKMMTVGGSGSIFNNPEIAGKMVSGINSTFANANNPLKDFYNRQAILATGESDPLEIAKQMENIDVNPDAKDKRRQFALARVDSQFGSISKNRNSRYHAATALKGIYGVSLNQADEMLNFYDEKTKDIKFGGKGSTMFDSKMLSERSKERTGHYELGETMLADVSAKAGEMIGKSVAHAILPGQELIARVIGSIFNMDSKKVDAMLDKEKVSKKPGNQTKQTNSRGGR